MKLLSFTILTIISFSSYGVEFHSCTDEKGQTHYTNLPSSSLNSNCVPKDHYSVMLNQDYLNLSKEHAKYEEENNSKNITSESFDFTSVDISPDAVKNKISDIFDPDKALEELMEATEDRDDVFTRAIRGRTSDVQDSIKRVQNIQETINRVQDMQESIKE